ncbi:MAG: cation ABC transporter substrate-binding protein, partial [Burkholderia sp.]|nr:cation ABC transporter substrate-binding protein [Burkholderia sp.]
MSIALKRAPRRALSPVRWLAAAVAALSLAAPAFAQAATVNVVAAENFYGDVATQI